MRKFATLLLTACLASSVMAQAQTQIKDPFRIATKENIAAANAAAANNVRISALREFALTKGLADGRQQKFQEIHQYLYYILFVCQSIVLDRYF